MSRTPDRPVPVSEDTPGRHSSRPGSHLPHTATWLTAWALPLAPSLMAPEPYKNSQHQESGEEVLLDISPLPPQGAGNLNKGHFYITQTLVPRLSCNGQLKPQLIMVTKSPAPGTRMASITLENLRLPEQSITAVTYHHGHREPRVLRVLGPWPQKHDPQ